VTATSSSIVTTDRVVPDDSHTTRDHRLLDAERRAAEAEARAAARERRIEALERAVESRGPIEQAKGILMGVFDLGPDAAFDVLVWVSQHTNTKLATVTERFLAEVGRTELGEEPREPLTLLLAHLDHPTREPYDRS
jgi:hypothetical protein